MKFKLIFAMAETELTDKVIETARGHGATGCTVITSVRGEGLKPAQTFLGLTIAGQRDIVLFIVEEHHSREILEAIAITCEFDTKPGTGLAFKLDIEDAIGLHHQIALIEQEISEEDL